MSNPKKTHDLIRQNEYIVKKSQKHDANLQKNSTLYFQLGLIVCLLTAFGLLEMKFETTIPSLDPPIEMDDPDYVDIPLIKDVRPVIEEPIAKTQVKNPERYIEVEYDIPDRPFLEEPEKQKMVSSPLDPDLLPDLPEAPIDEDVPMYKVETVPIYPGCEKAKDNERRKKCMSEKIAKLIQRKFEGSDIASNYGLKGRQKIDVQFKIDKSGHVTNVITRSPHPKLDEEAVRVINFIPEMTPGKQRDKNVGVIYNLPIIFEVQ